MLGSFYVNAAWQPCVAAVYWRRASELVLNIACLKHHSKANECVNSPPPFKKSLVFTWNRLTLVLLP